MLYFGIDLGTTNSCIARYDKDFDQLTVIPNIKAQSTTPSVVYLPASDAPEVVGDTAINQLKVEPKRVITYTKRLIANDKKFKEDNAFDNYPTFRGIKQNPITISSMILKSLTFNNPGFKEIVGNDDFAAVVTFPAYFTDEAKARTKQAAELAGLKKVEMIEEPIAAALSYGVGHDNKNETVLVYDLGGGTFDVTIIQFDSNGNGKVLAKEGDPYLGGGDWDNNFGYYLWQRYNELNKQPIELTLEDFDYLKNNRALEIGVLKRVNKFRLLAQEAKHRLTDLTETDVPIDDDTVIKVTREEFDDQTKLLLLRSFGLVDQVLQDLEERQKDQGQNINITSVLLVGGSSLMPQVKQGLEEQYSQFVGRIHLHDPHLAVAKGAAIYCDAVFGTPNPASKPIKKIDTIASFSYGIESCDTDGKGNVTDTHIALLIKKGDTLPATVSNEFCTITRQDRIRILVYRSEAQDDIASLDQGEVIGKENMFRFNSYVPPNTGVVVTMLLEESGLLHVSAKSKVDNGYLEFELKAVGTMSDTECRAFQASQRK